MKLAEGIIYGTYTFKSAKAKHYNKLAVAKLREIKSKMKWPTLDCELSLSILVFYTDSRHRLDVELFSKCFKKSGIIADLRQITETHSCRIVDKNEEPRLIFALHDTLTNKQWRASMFKGEFL